MDLFNKSTRKIVTTLIMITLVWSSLFAQDINEGQAFMSLGQQNSFSLEIDDINKKSIIASWQKFNKENKYGKYKRNKKADEYFSNNIVIQQLKGKNPFSIYSKMEQKGKNVILTSWVDLGGKFISTNDTPEEAVAFSAILENYYLFAKKYKLENVLKTENKTLKGLNKTLKKLKKRKSKLEKSIVKNEDKIEDNRFKIESLENDKIVQISAIEKAKSLLQESYDQDATDDVIKTNKKAVKSEEKSFQKMKKQIRSLKDSIIKMERKIEDNQEEIAENEIQQEKQVIKIENQESEIEKLKEEIEKYTVEK